MSDLRELRDTVERVFKQVCRLSAENKNLARLQGDLGDIFGRLALAVAKQEALSPAPQENREHVEPKGSSVEYYKDRLARVAVHYCKNEFKYSNMFHDVVKDYETALSASPDPEGSWEWVPNTHLVAPKMITSVMCVAGQNAAEDKIDCVEVGQIYRAILAARPPIPKKGESV